MMRPPDESNVTALLAASRNEDAVAVASIWRELTPAQQEDVLFTLLRIQSDPDPGAVPVEQDEGPDQVMDALADTAAMTPVEQTEPIPKIVEDLRGLTASESDDEVASADPPAAPHGLAEYQSRWLRSWKWSVLVAGWAVTTTFAFIGDFSSFGPMEWVVTAVGGGVLVGTLANFAVAALATRSQGQRQTAETRTKIGT